MVVKIKKGFKKTAKGGGNGGGAGRVLYIPKTGVTVRFLTGPTGWVSFEQFWDGGKYTVVTEENQDEIPLRSNGYPATSTRYLAPAIDKSNNRVVAVQLPYTLANKIALMEEKYEKKGWEITEYDIELSKEGEGTDTTYEALFDEKSELDLSLYELPDLEALIEEMAAPKAAPVAAEIDDDTDTDDEPKEAAPVKKLLKRG